MAQRGCKGEIQSAGLKTAHPSVPITLALVKNSLDGFYFCILLIPAQPSAHSRMTEGKSEGYVHSPPLPLRGSLPLGVLFLLTVQQALPCQSVTPPSVLSMWAVGSPVASSPEATGFAWTVSLFLTLPLALSSLQGLDLTHRSGLIFKKSIPPTQDRVSLCNSLTALELSL